MYPDEKPHLVQDAGEHSQLQGHAQVDADQPDPHHWPLPLVTLLTLLGICWRLLSCLDSPCTASTDAQVLLDVGSRCAAISAHDMAGSLEDPHACSCLRDPCHVPVPALACVRALTARMQAADMRRHLRRVCWLRTLLHTLGLLVLVLMLLLLLLLVRLRLLHGHVGVLRPPLGYLLIPWGCLLVPLGGLLVPLGGLLRELLVPLGGHDPSVGLQHAVGQGHRQHGLHGEGEGCRGSYGHLLRLGCTLPGFWAGGKGG